MDFTAKHVNAPLKFAATVEVYDFWVYIFGSLYKSRKFAHPVKLGQCRNLRSDVFHVKHPDEGSSCHVSRETFKNRARPRHNVSKR